jgi:hypothetical protein
MIAQIKDLLRVKKGGTVKSFYSFLLVANGLSIALLIGFCAVISAKAAWKGMPVAALAVSGVKAAVFLLNILLLRGRTPLILALAGIGIDIALIVLFLSIAMKAKMKAPSAVAAVTVLFSLVLMLPNGLMRTELGRYAYRFLSIFNFGSFLIPIGYAIALILALALKDETGSKAQG